MLTVRTLAPDPLFQFKLLANFEGGTNFESNVCPFMIVLLAFREVEVLEPLEAADAADAADPTKVDVAESAVFFATVEIARRVAAVAVAATDDIAGVMVVMFYILL